MKKNLLMALMVVPVAIRAEITNPAAAPTNMENIAKVYSPENVARAHEEGLLLSPAPTAPEATAPNQKIAPAQPVTTPEVTEPVSAEKPAVEPATEPTTNTTYSLTEEESPYEDEFVFEEDTAEQDLD